MLASKTPKTLNPAAELLLKTAERLYALEGVDNVSFRQISREAGQKNHSALQYHFGNREQLIEAIMDYRMLPVNTKRQQMLDRLKSDGQDRNVRLLVEAFILPLTNELLKPPADSYYISLLAQLFSGHQSDVGDVISGHPNERSWAIRQVNRSIISAMKPVSEVLVNARILFMLTQMIYTVSSWDYKRRAGTIVLDAETLTVYSTQLVDFIVGGLTTPESN